MDRDFEFFMTVAFAFRDGSGSTVVPSKGFGAAARRLEQKGLIERTTLGPGFIPSAYGVHIFDKCQELASWAKPKGVEYIGPVFRGTYSS